MNTGHDGSITTLHANSARDALSRLETMSMYAGIDLPEKNIKSQIVSAIDLIIQISRMQDGSRKITAVSEVTGMEGNVIVMQEIFSFEQTGIENMKVQGHHISTGVRPNFVEKLKARNLSIPGEYFSKDRMHTYVGGSAHGQQSAHVAPKTEPVIKQRLMKQQDNIFNQRLQK